MKRVAMFKKVSLNQFIKDWVNTFGNKGEDVITEIYENICLPVRKTAGSAGYDIESPLDFVLRPGETIKIPTGIRCYMDKDWVLTCYPRSSLGFKYRLWLDNGVGIVDNDYFNADNEGHIFLKMTNNSLEGKDMIIKAGDGIAQGIFLQHGVTFDDDATDKRFGGFGSTDKKE